MSRFKPASAEELARRGLNADGSPIKTTPVVLEMMTVHLKQTTLLLLM